MRSFKTILVSLSTAFASLIYTKKRIQKTNKLRIMHSHDDATDRFKNN